MIRLFNLWSLYRNQDGTFEFDVTEANFPGVKDGTEEWVRACLAALGVEVGISTWKLMPMRSFYYTDYPTDRNWLDRWRAGWAVYVVPSGSSPPLENQLFLVPSGTEAADATWSPGIKESAHDNTALLISDHRNTLQEVRELRQAFLAEQDLSAATETRPEVAIRSYKGDLLQLRVTLHGVNFPEVIPALERMLQYLRQQGGAINWRDRLTW